MFANFNAVLHPELKWQDKCLTDLDPCLKCPTMEEYRTVALYGSIAERQYAELPKSCGECVERLLWEADCFAKLRWYEEHDERLSKT